MDLLTVGVFAVIFVAFLTRATFGFGDALVAMPFLILLIGLDQAAPLIGMLSITIALAILVTQWKNIVVGSATRLVMFGLVGIYSGTHFRQLKDAFWLEFILGIVILLFGLYSLAKPKLIHLKTDRTSGLFGMMAGFLSMVYNAPGPPLIIYGAMRQWKPEEFRATLQSYFFPSSIIVLAVHGAEGRLTWEVTWYYLWSLPIVVVCLLLGNRWNRKFQTAKFVRMVYLFLILIGCLMILKVFWNSNRTEQKKTNVTYCAPLFLETSIAFSSRKTELLISSS